MKNIKVALLLTSFFVLFSTMTIAQISANYNEVISKQKKGQIDKYITQKGEEFKVGDTITIGVAFRNEQFDFIQQNAGISYYPLQNTASNSKVVIKSMNIKSKIVVVNTTKPQGYVYGLLIVNFESALLNGEVMSKIMSSDEALSELKKCKDKLDLGLISEEEYKKKKEELSKYIK
jgi:hypothetical protein